MNDPSPKPSSPTPPEETHHLQKRDVERAASSGTDSCVPLVCSDEECFVPGSELDACTGADQSPATESTPPAGPKEP